MNEKQKETAIQNEQQLNKKDIINDIIKILANNNLSVSNAREILRITSKKLGEQRITVSI